MAIVCGTDFSVWSKAAMHAAAVLAGARGEALTLVHVMEPQVEEMDDDARARVLGLLQQRLAAEAAELKPLAKGVVEAAVLSGRADEVIRSVAGQQRASLIVVGSAGHGATALAQLGGTSERLASATDIPVLVVRDGEPFQQWKAGEPLKVLLGVDDTAASASAARWVLALRKVMPVDLVVGRVYYADEAHQRYGLGRRFSYTDPDPAVEALIERDLKRRVPHPEGSGEVFYRARLGVGRVADHLLELAEAERCQLVVVGTHKRRGLARMWSVSAASLHHARTAVAVVPVDGLDTGSLAALPRLRRVLVTTDFSAFGNAAVPWAYAMVEPGGEVTLAHVTVVESTGERLVEEYLPGVLPQPHAQVEREVAARLRALTPASAEEKQVLTRTEVVRSGDAARAICEAAERVGADAVIIASHGRAGVLRTLLGSVAEEVLRNSGRPVMVIRPPAR